MNPEIEKLIKLAVADGEITENEKAVIIRKAEKLGEDIDEVELILNGELALKKENTNKTVVEIKSNKEGVLIKCPSCGAPVPSLSLRCEACGHEFRNTESTQNIKDFYKQIKSAKLEDKSTIISNFPVPNNKEDLIEFITLSVGHSNSISSEERVSYMTSSFKGTYRPELHYRENEIIAWQSKAEAALMKAKLLFSEDAQMIQYIKKFEEQYDNNKNSVKRAEQKRAKMVLIFVLAVIILFFIGGYFISR